MSKKQFISLILALALALSALVPASAEEPSATAAPAPAEPASMFTLRNGIRFGMTIEEIEALETWQRVTGWHLFSYTGAMLGYESLVQYQCNDETKGLEGVMYLVGTCYNEDGTTRYAETDRSGEILMGLLLKYGQKSLLTDADPDGNAALDIYIMVLSSMAGDEADFEAINPEPDTAMVFLVPDGDRSVRIDLRCYKITQDGQTRFLNVLFYSRWSEKTIQKFRSYKEDL